MIRRLPIKAIKDLAKQYDLEQVILFGWDGECSHCVTYGRTVVDCDQAAQGGNKIKKMLGWPDRTMAVPSRVLALKRTVKKLKAELKGLKEERAERKREEEGNCKYS